MPGYYGGGGGGGAATTFNQYASFFEKAGPASYPTGGFVIDLSATYATLTRLKLMVQKGKRGSLPMGRLEITLNSPSAGKATVKVQKHQYERVSSFDNVTGQPGGVTVQAASGATTAAEATHVHSLAHDHASVTSSAAAAAGAGVTTNILGTGMVSHTHPVDPPNLTGNTGAGASHNHVDNNIYQHQHALTHTPTNVTIAEVANATDLSATIFDGIAQGVRA